MVQDNLKRSLLKGLATSQMDPTCPGGSRLPVVKPRFICPLDRE